MVSISKAKSMWCPMTRSTAISNHNGMPCSTNTFDESYVTPTCYADQCMMWRFSTISGQSDKETTGYCGLAGECHVFR